MHLISFQGTSPGTILLIPRLCRDIEGDVVAVCIRLFGNVLSGILTSPSQMQSNAFLLNHCVSWTDNTPCHLPTVLQYTRGGLRYTESCQRLDSSHNLPSPALVTRTTNAGQIQHECEVMTICQPPIMSVHHSNTNCAYRILCGIAYAYIKPSRSNIPNQPHDYIHTYIPNPQNLFTLTVILCILPNYHYILTNQSSTHCTPLMADDPNATANGAQPRCGG